jgi:hypothetical protein
VEISRASETAIAEMVLNAMKEGFREGEGNKTN